MESTDSNFFQPYVIHPTIVPKDAPWGGEERRGGTLSTMNSHSRPHSLSLSHSLTHCHTHSHSHSLTPTHSHSLLLTPTHNSGHQCTGTPSTRCRGPCSQLLNKGAHRTADKGAILSCTNFIPANGSMQCALQYSTRRYPKGNRIECETAVRVRLPQPIADIPPNEIHPLANGLLMAT